MIPEEPAWIQPKYLELGIANTEGPGVLPSFYVTDLTAGYMPGCCVDEHNLPAG